MRSNTVYAQLVNVRIQLDNGQAEKIDVINVCDDSVCSTGKCIDTDETYSGTRYKESVRLLAFLCYFRTAS